MSLNTGALRSAAFWVVIVLAVASGVIGAIAGTWQTVLLAGVLIVLALLNRLMARQARPRR